MKHGSCVLFGMLIAAMVCGVPLWSQDRPDALELYKTGRYKEAIDVCLNEIKEMPKNMDSYTVLGWCLLKLERYNEALEYGKKALAVTRYDHRISEIMGEAYFFLGNNLEALKYLEEYVTLAPTGDRIELVYYFMGEIFIRLGEFNNADIAFSTAVNHAPNNAKWWARLGYAREMAADFKFSLEAYEKALALNPSLVEAQRGKARVESKIENG